MNNENARDTMKTMVHGFRFVKKYTNTEEFVVAPGYIQGFLQKNSRTHLN